MTFPTPRELRARLRDSYTFWCAMDAVLALLLLALFALCVHVMDLLFNTAADSVLG